MDNFPERIELDEDGRRWLTDEQGHLLRDERGDCIPPTHARPKSRPGEFLTYDTSQGHCALCGRLTCRGDCFR